MRSQVLWQRSSASVVTLVDLGVAHGTILVWQVRLIVRNELGFVLGTEHCLFTQLFMFHLHFFSLKLFTLSEKSLFDSLVWISLLCVLVLTASSMVYCRCAQMFILSLIFLLILIFLLKIPIDLLIVARDGPFIPTWQVLF